MEDLNHDGNLDMVAASSMTGTTSVLVGRGALLQNG
jgi:hypothetical protein